MDELEYKQIRERLLKDSAFQALHKAEKRMHDYACALDVGDERTKAFEIFENIRNAARVGS